MMLEFEFHSDPGHGWLKVPRGIVESVGIKHSITQYSYQRGSDVYLEEDCDMPLFVNACKKAGVAVSYKECYSDPTPIRSYQRYTP